MFHQRARYLALAIIMTVAGGIAAGCSSASSDGGGTGAAPGPIPSSVPPGTTLRVGDQLDFLQTPLAAAAQNDNFPYAVKYSSFIGGPAMLQAFEAGAVDIGWISEPAPIVAQAARQDVVAVAAYGTQKGRVGLVAAPGQNFEGWASLKGTKVAFMRGTVLQTYLLRGLDSVGLSLHDIEPVNVKATDIPQTLDSGSVPTATLAQPVLAKYLAEHPGSKLLAEGDPFDNLGFVMASKSALNDPAKVAAIGDYFRRLQNAFNWANAHPTEWAQAFDVNVFKLTEPEAQKDVAHEGPTCFYPLSTELLRAQQGLADLLAKAGEIPAKLDVTSEFDGRFNSVLDKAPCP